MQFIVKLEHKDFYKNEGVFKALFDLSSAVGSPKNSAAKTLTTEEVSKISGVNLDEVSAEKAAPPQEKPAAPQENAVAPKVEKPTYTIEEVRKAFGDLSRAKGKDAAKGILSEMGYAKVTEIPPDKYADAMERIQEVS